MIIIARFQTIMLAKRTMYHALPVPHFWASPSLTIFHLLPTLTIRCMCSVSQRFFLFKQLKIRHLNQAALDIVFHSLVLNKITYASQSFSGYLLKQHIDRLQAILNKAKKWGLVFVFHNVRDILENQDYRLFRQILSNPQHSLNRPTIIPPVRSSSTFGTRDRGHPYEMPGCKYNLHMQFFVNRCSLNTYESNHKTGYAVYAASALIM